MAVSMRAGQYLTTAMVDRNAAREIIRAINAAVPGGADGQVQYGSGGAFAGSPALTFAAGTGTLAATAFAGDGFALTNLNATNLASGHAIPAVLGLGTPTTSTYLRGDGTWQVPPGGGGSVTPPGGFDTQVQYNSAGTFAGSSALTFVAGTGTLTATAFAGGGANLTGLNASNLATGTVAAGLLATATTPAAADNSATIATTAFVKAQNYVTAATAPVTSVATRTGAVMLSVGDVAGAAPLASPALSGTPTAPTAAPGTSTTQVATTAYVVAQGYAVDSGVVHLAGAESVTGVKTFATGQNIGTGTGAAALNLNGAAGQLRQINLLSGGVARWKLTVSAAAESGSNAGSDLLIQTYADDGSGGNNPLTIVRSSGLVTIPNALNVGKVVQAGTGYVSLAQGMAGGRLTLNASNPGADVSNGGTLAYVAFTGRHILLWSTALSDYELVNIAAVASVPLAAYTPNTNYDIFIQNQGNGAAIIAPVAWSGANTRATAITAADGMWFLGTTVPNANRYVGTIRITGSAGSATSQDTAGFRYIWNLYNPVRKRLAVAVADPQWSNSTTNTATWTWRTLAGNAANVAWVVSGMTNGWGAPTVDLTATAWIGPVANGTFALGLMRNGMTQPSHVWAFATGATGNISLSARWADQAPLGQASYGPYEGILASSGTASYTGLANGGGMDGTYTC